MELHRGKLIRCYRERFENVHAMFMHAVSGGGDSVALVAGDQRLTFDGVAARGGRVAAGLARQGVSAGDRVAVVLSNRVEAVLMVLATARLDAILVPIGTRLRKPEIAFIVANAGA